MLLELRELEAANAEELIAYLVHLERNDDPAIRVTGELRGR